MAMVILEQVPHTSSHIESILADLKSNIKKIYHNIPSKGLLYFIKESEFSYLVRNKIEIEILDFLQKILKFLGEILIFMMKTIY